MTKTRFALAAGLFALAGGFTLQASTPALALTMKECSTKYQAAKTGNTLNGQSCNDFRKTQCSDGAAAAPAAPTSAAAEVKCTHGCCCCIPLQMCLQHSCQPHCLLL